MTLHPGDAGWLLHPGDERPGEMLEHPAVVLREVQGRFVVIHGTRTPRDRNGTRLTGVPESSDNAFWIDPESEDGRTLGLTARTYFHRKAVEIVRRAEDFRVVTECPPDLLAELRILAGITR